jgi:hypothetical protein
LSWTGDSGATPCGCPSGPLAPERERRGHRRAVDHPAGGDDRHVDLRPHERQQHHRRDVARVLEAAALAALHHEPVDAGVDAFSAAVQRRHDVEHGQPPP